MTAPFFPGNTAISGLQVYSDTGPDGVHGGSPHVHTVSTEAYIVLGGTGILHTLDAGEGSKPRYQQHPLASGSVLWFGPGVIHRVENHGDLRVTVVMSNSGLPESGDAVMTFPPEILANPDEYAQAATLPTEPAARAEAAAERRNLAVEGFRILLADVDERGGAALDEFYERAVRLVRRRAPDWRTLFEQGTERLTVQTARQIDAVAAGLAEHLADGRVAVATTSAEPAFGMCGMLQVPRIGTAQ